jgi:uncharacterized protein (DUF1697 family)
MNPRYVALLRGINVGGTNVITMADLRACFGRMGCTEVVTYIQSGNVVFSSRQPSSKELTETIEQTLARTFRYDARVVVRSAEELQTVVAQAPPGFGEDASQYRYDVLFVRPPLTTRAALEEVTTKPGVDTAEAGDFALYFRRLIRRAAESHLSRLVQRPAYQHITIRNWRTSTRLLRMVLAPTPTGGGT